MKRFKRILACALVLAVCFTVWCGISASAAVSQQGYVKGTYVSIRASASTSGTWLGQTGGEYCYITVTGSVNTGENYPWYAVTYGGLSGYMYGQYIDLIPTAITPQTATVVGTDVRIRSLCHTNAASNTLRYVSNVEITVTGIVYTGESYPWYAVTYDGTSGYMYGQFIRINTPAPPPEADHDFETQLTAFPESYKPYLRSLHAQYPNWVFRADNLAMSFDEAVNNEYIFPRKLVNLSWDGVSWRSMDAGVYDWNTGVWTDTAYGWTGAAKQVIKYYMDPRNYLNTSRIYAFLKQGYDATQTAEGVAQIVAGTFLANGYSDPEDTAYGGSYINVIMAAAQQSGVSPYILASTIIQEQGVSGDSPLISGATGYGKYFNFFNISASGDDVIGNGLRYAQSKGWTTRSAAIIGGAAFYASGYISGGQDTYFYKNFDLLNAPYYTHQYAQSIYDSYSSASHLVDVYATNTSAPLIFRIPVYTSIPDAVCEKPVENGLLNNHYLLGMSVDGFSMYNYYYNVWLSGDRVIEVTLPAGASLVSSAPHKLTAGTHAVEIAVRAQTGYTNSYYLTVNAASDCTLYISPCAGNHTHSDWQVVTPSGNYTIGSQYRYCTICGVTTEMGEIAPLLPLTANTLASIRRELLMPTGTFDADVNGDGIANVVDLVKFKKRIVMQ